MTQQVEKNWFAFVIMPFGEKFKDVYEELIKPPLEAQGYKVQRADRVFDQRNIMRDVIIFIYRADLIISDLSDRNPNVMYELGVAHGLQKPVVLLTKIYKTCLLIFALTVFLSIQQDSMKRIS